jgi:hypothetical protein
MPKDIVVYFIVTKNTLRQGLNYSTTYMTKIAI